MVVAVLVVVLLLCGAAPGHAQANAAATDCELLLQFKASMANGAEVLSSWVDGTDCCAWMGITCAGNRTVTSMTLIQLGLVGTVPAAGWELPPGLQSLELGINNISGTIPSGWKLPDKLETIYWESNLLSGSLPADLALPTATKNVLFQKNQLTGPLPPLSKTIVNVNLASNQFTGSIPASYEAIPSLQIIDLSNNALSGALPANFTFNSSLQYNGLWVYGNAFSGTLPSWPGSKASVAVLPGNEGLCGDVPTTPNYIEVNETLSTFGPLAPAQNGSGLPPCGGAPAAPPSPAPDDGTGNSTSTGAEDEGGSSNTAAIVGGVVGGVAGLCVVAGLAWWYVRSKKPKTVGQEEGDAEKGSNSKGYDSDNLHGQSRSTADVPSRDSGTATRAWTTNGSSASNNIDSGLANDALLNSIASKLSTASRPGGSKNSSKASSGGSGALAKGGSQGAGSSGSWGSRQLGVDVKAYLVDFNDVHFKKLIGRGAFGRVYLAQWNETMVAAKMLLGEAEAEGDMALAADQVLTLSSPALKDLEQEASLMAALRHPHVLAFMGLCLQPPLIISEYCPRGSLFDVLHEARSSPTLAAQLTWSVRLRLAMGAALGVHYLHTFNPPVIHRDLKSANLLISHNWTTKIADFNLSKLLSEGSLGIASSTAVGNPRWLAPEVLQGSSHSFASDTYSFGLIMWELLTWRPPFEGTTNPWQVSSEVISGVRPPIPAPDQLPGPGSGDYAGLSNYIELMQRCWAQEPENRPAMTEIITELRYLVALSSQRPAS